MTEEQIRRTFETAANVICQAQIDGEIDVAEVEMRLERARQICLRETLRALGLHVEPVNRPGWIIAPYRT